MQPLIQHLQYAYENRSTHYRRFDPSLQTYLGVEDALPSYHWDGRKRSADASYPFVVFQYTLDGWGYYEEPGQQTTCTAGTLFTAVVPGDHCYYRPKASPRWLVLWVVMHHPYIVQRVAERRGSIDTACTVDAGHPLMLRLIDLFEESCRGTPYDVVTQEQYLFAVLWEYERLALRGQLAQPQRERLLEDVRQFIITELHRPIEVRELADRQGMSRSYFSHRFREITGLSPAQYVQRVRLEEAATRLLHSEQTIEQITRETGFATATHFCRVFRNRFHLSPGEFRRQMR